MADDAAQDNSGQGCTDNDGGGKDVTRVFYIRNGIVSVDDTDIPLASSQIEIGSKDKRRAICFSLTCAQSERFGEAWQRVVHSMSQANPEYLVSDYDPSATPDVRYRSDVRKFSHVNYCDVTYRSALHAELRSTGASRVDSDFIDITYADTSYKEVTYATARGKRLIDEQPIGGEILIPLTFRGDSRHGNRRMVIQVDGIDSVEVRSSLAGSDLVDVVLQLATGLSVEKLIWLIESE